MRIELLSADPASGGLNYVDVRDAIKAGDLFAVREANQFELDDSGRATRISFQKAEDDRLIALAQRVVTGWSFQVPLPKTFAQMKAVLSDFEVADLRKFREGMRPLLDAVAGDEGPDTKGDGGEPANAVDDRPASEAEG